MKNGERCFLRSDESKVNSFGSDGTIGRTKRVHFGLSRAESKFASTFKTRAEIWIFIWHFVQASSTLCPKVIIAHRHSDSPLSRRDLPGASGCACPNIAASFWFDRQTKRGWWVSPRYPKSNRASPRSPPVEARELQGQGTEVHAAS